MSSTKAPHFDFVTLFPDAVDVWLRTSILGRAHDKGLFTFKTVQLREFATDAYRSVDDAPYGGGGGMVLRIEPLVAAVEALKAEHPGEQSLVVYFSPRGRRIDTELLENLQERPARHYIFICGHYEGVDERFCSSWVDLEVSLGDFVITGGELPAVALADALVRKLSGTLASEHAVEQESFSLRDPENGARLLEYPQYTRPADFRGQEVPDVLLSGDHGRIARWRLEKARQATEERLATR